MLHVATLAGIGDSTYGRVETADRGCAAASAAAATPAADTPDRSVPLPAAADTQQQPTSAYATQHTKELLDATTSAMNAGCSHEPAAGECSQPTGSSVGNLAEPRIVSSRSDSNGKQDLPMPLRPHDLLGVSLWGGSAQPSEPGAGKTGGAAHCQLPVAYAETDFQSDVDTILPFL